MPINNAPVYVTLRSYWDAGAYYERYYEYQISTEPVVAPMEIQYYINDHLGTPQQLVNQNQEVTWAADYQAFGEAEIETELVTNPHRFPGAILRSGEWFTL